MSTSEQIIFLVHTNQYSGNFERELCADITGQVGDCGVGEDLATLFEEELGEEVKEEFAEIIGSKQDDDHGGCWRRCEIYPTPGRLNTGYGEHFDAAEGQTGFPAYELVAIYFDQKPSAAQLALMKHRTAEYAETMYNRKGYHEGRDALTITGFELIREITEVKKVREVI